MVVRMGQRMVDPTFVYEFRIGDGSLPVDRNANPK
jgi:hypothetical protein